MIIDYKYKYIFIGLPFSASSAISKELLEQYKGHPLLSKHANIPSLLKERPDINIQDYYIFAVIRDPIQMAYSRYNKFLTNPNEAYTNEKYFIENGGYVSKKARKIFLNIIQKKWTFEEYIKNVYRFHPYDNDLSINGKYLNGTIQFDQLSKDFHKSLNNIGINPVRDIPIYNKTNKVAVEYNISQDTIRKVFGPYYWHNRDFYNTPYKIKFYEKLYFKIFQFFRFYKRLRFDAIQNDRKGSMID